MWLSHAPQAYGFESGLWQASMICKMILDQMGIDIKPRTLRATLYRMRLSFRIPREVPHKSADPAARKKFIEDQKSMDALAEAGYASFYEDEMAMLLSAQTGRGWLRTRRARDNQDHLLQKVGEGVFAPWAGECRT